MIDGRGISRNFVMLSAGQILSRLLAFVVTIHMTRVLLPIEYGAIVFTATLMTYAGILVDFGFDSWAPLEVARGEIPVAKIVSNVVTSRLAMLMPALCILGLATWLMPLPQLTKVIILISGFGLILIAIDLTWLFLGSKSVIPAIVSDCLTQVIAAICVCTFVHRPSDVLYVPVVMVVAKSFSVVYLIVTYMRAHGTISLGIDRASAKHFLTAALPLVGSSIVGRILENFDILLLGLWAGGEAAGLYGASFRIVWMLMLITGAYYTALRPQLAQAFLIGFHHIEGAFDRITRLAVAVAIGVAVGGALVAKSVVLWVYGTAYASATQTLQILFVLLGVYMVNRLYRTLLISFNRQRSDLQIMTSAAAINIALNLIVIGKFGIAGAAAVNLVCEVVILLLDYLVCRNFVGNVWLLRHLWKPAIAACVMAIVINNTQFLPMFVQIALAGTAYIAALALMRAITREDLHFISKKESELTAVSADQSHQICAVTGN